MVVKNPFFFQSSLNGILFLEKLSLIKVKMLKMVQFGILSMENNEIDNFQILGFSFMHHSVRKCKNWWGFFGQCRHIVMFISYFCKYHDNAFYILNVCFILCITFRHYLNNFYIKIKRSHPPNRVLF